MPIPGEDYLCGITHRSASDVNRAGIVVGLLDRSPMAEWLRLVKFAATPAGTCERAHSQYPPIARRHPCRSALRHALTALRHAGKPIPYDRPKSAKD